jgi:hypothetical protein
MLAAALDRLKPPLPGESGSLRSRPSRRRRLPARNACVTMINVFDVYFTAAAEEWMMGLDDDDYDEVMARIAAA